MYYSSYFGGKITDKLKDLKSKIAPSASDKLAKQQAEQRKLQAKIDAQTAKAKADIMNTVKSQKKKMCSDYSSLYGTINSKFNNNNLFRSDQDVLDLNSNLKPLMSICAGSSFGRKRSSKTSSEIRYLRSLI